MSFDHKLSGFLAGFLDIDSRSEVVGPVAEVHSVERVGSRYDREFAGSRGDIGIRFSVAGALASDVDTCITRGHHAQHGQRNRRKQNS